MSHPEQAADLSIQLRDAVAAGERKERLIADLKSTADERLELIERLDTLLGGLREQLQEKEHANVEIGRAARESVAAASARLGVIERLEMTAQHRLAVIHELDGELKRQRTEILEAEFVARTCLAVVAELQRELEAARLRVSQHEWRAPKRPLT